MRILALLLVIPLVILPGCSKDSGCKNDSDCPFGFECVDGRCKQKSNGNGEDKMVDVPAGPFEMGCNDQVDSNCDPDESPYHTVNLSAFQIDEFEVTQGRYQECIDAGGCFLPGTDTSCKWDPVGRADHPVVCVTWDQARGYCLWAGKRLPTEAEWEKAARGAAGQLYPWGNLLPTCNQSNFGDCNDDTLPVGSVPNGKSPYGAQDMAGNVYEWVNDWYGEAYYESGPEDDPQGPDSGTHRIMRGGAWGYEPVYLRSSNRGANEQAVYRYPLGFRCAKSVD